MRKKRKQAESETPQLEPRRITPVDIQQKEFRLAMRGYNERDVDQFLDDVTEELARLYADNKRLREEIEFNRTTRLQTTDTAEAEAIIRQAREEAARIIVEAGARASTMASTGDPNQQGASPGLGAGGPSAEIMSLFLARERAFLQNMANLIQAHAEGVKQDVRRIRDRVVRQAPAGPESAAPAGPPEDQASAPEARQPAHSETSAEQAETLRGEPAPTPSATDEPTQAWEMASGTEGAENEPSPHELVDLTEGQEAEAERVRGRPQGQGSGGNEALSWANGPNRAVMQTGPPVRPGRDARAAGEVRPRVEDEDAREDRSLRELFWGED